MTPNETSETDRLLVAEFLSTRSEAAFLRLHDRHAEALYRFAARLAGGPGPDADDLVQDAWIEAITHLQSFRWRSTLRTWLCGIVLNRWRQSWQRQGRDQRRNLALVESERPAPADPALAIRLEQAMSALPGGYREVMVLHDVEGYTHQEIASHFGIAEGTSKSQLHRARRALREALGKKGAAQHAG